MIKTVLKQGVYGKIRIIENYPAQGVRSYVHKTNLKTYVVSSDVRLTLDSMLEVDKNYHFSTLKELHTALNA